MSLGRRTSIYEAILQEVRTEEGRRWVMRVLKGLVDRECPSAKEEAEAYDVENEEERRLKS